MDDILARVIEQSIALTGVIIGAYIVWFVYTHRG